MAGGVRRYADRGGGISEQGVFAYALLPDLRPGDGGRIRGSEQRERVLCGFVCIRRGVLFRGGVHRGRHPGEDVPFQMVGLFPYALQHQGKGMPEECGAVRLRRHCGIPLCPAHAGEGDQPGSHGNRNCHNRHLQHGFCHRPGSFRKKSLGIPQEPGGRWAAAGIQGA